MVTAFASCKKTEQTPEPDQTTESTTTETTTEEDSDSTLGPAESKNKIIGTWVYDETISPQKFYGDYYNSKITKTNVQMSTTYKFNKDGTYSTTVEIINISDVRKEYRSLMVEGARRNVEREGKFLTTDDVLYYEKYADDILKDICKTTKGTYKIDGNKLVYNNSETEQFAISGNKLTLDKIVLERK